jgi:hypothetical protein
MKIDDAATRGIFWGGLTGGLASALPFLQLGNCFCCLWAWVSGAVALLLIRRPTSDSTVPAASLGALAGAWAGLVAGLLGLFTTLLLGPPAGLTPEDLSALLPVDLDPQLWADFGFLSASNPLAVLFTTLLRIGLFALFGMLGALITAALRPRAGD